MRDAVLAHPALLPREAFIGIEHVAHLAAGGETPALRSHLDAVARFLCDKGAGMPGRQRFSAVAGRVKAALGRLLGGRAEDVALLASASEGVFVAASGIEWRPGDNVVVQRMEYPSMLHPWQQLAPRGVTVRAVGSWPVPSLDELAQAVDDRTRVIAASHVSYLTGARQDLAALRKLADRVGARLVVDASHALGVVSVPGELCDLVVSCAYKWLLGVHGVGVCYVNGERWPDLAPPWVGWHSVLRPEDWRARETGFQPKADAGRFEIGNPPFMAAHALASGLETIERVGVPAIEAHVLALGGALRKGLVALGLEVLTPEPAAARAGNIVIAAADPAEVERRLGEAGVVVWASEGRVRLSVHLYNDHRDVARALGALARLVAAGRSAGLTSP